MNAIIGFTELLEKHMDDPELAKSYINKIQISSDSLYALFHSQMKEKGIAFRLL